MQRTSADILEFDALRELIGRFVQSPLGRAELSQVAPSSERARIESILADTAEAIEYLRAVSQPQAAGRGAAIRVRFDSIPDAISATQLLRIEGSTLESRQIYDLSQLLDQAGEARGILNTAAERFPRLATMTAGIPDFRSLVRDIRSKILADG